LKIRLWLLGALFVVLGLLLVLQVEAGDFPWKDDFNYASVADMQAAGWALVNPDGVSLQPDGVVIDGTKADTVIRYYNFPGGIYDWSIETRSMWLGVGHSGPGLNVVTAGHSYGIAADGWYDHFLFDADGELESFGSYSEQANVWVTMSITKKGNTVSAYFNGELIKTYTEQDSASHGLTGVARIAPWKGVMLYDYFQVDDIAGGGDSGFPILYVAVGGGVAAAVIGAAVYFFFIAGGSAAATTAAAGAAVGATSALAGEASGGIVATNTPGAIDLDSASLPFEFDPDAFSGVLSNMLSDSVSDIMGDLGYQLPSSVFSGELAAEIPDPSIQNVAETVRGTIVDSTSNALLKPVTKMGGQLLQGISPLDYIKPYNGGWAPEGWAPENKQNIPQVKPENQPSESNHNSNDAGTSEETG
jgi:hypothetical protein